MSAQKKVRKRLKKSNGSQQERGTKRSFSENNTEVPLNKLPWSKSSLSKDLDDAEGFYELEELSDVEIVKDEDSGLVKYRLANKKQRLDSSQIVNPPTKNSIGTGDEDSWSGFDDEPSETTEHTKPSRKDKAETKPAKSKGKSAPMVSKQSNGFSALQDSSEVSDVDLSEWNELHLDASILEALARLGFTSPTSIQQKAIPLIQDGHDVIGKASTGSGKTLAFGIPICQHIITNGPSQKHDTKPLIALVLSPTRELAHQIAHHLQDLSLSEVNIATVTGGLSLHKQQRQIDGANIVVATPGRLWEILSSSRQLRSRAKGVKYLVLDEADRLLSEGHFKELEEILTALDREEDDDADDSDGKDTSSEDPEPRQTLVFSATFQKDLQQKLNGKSRPAELLGKHESMEYLLRKLKFREEKPCFVDVNPISQMATNLREFIVECAGAEKDLFLYSSLMLHPERRVLVFANSISSVRRLVPFLQNLGMSVFGIHSQMIQKARLRAIERFKAGTGQQVDVLVATDVAARGLDVPHVDLVIHYHVPHAADMYVHRSGRTARAERSGGSILLCAPEESQGVRRLIAKVHARGAAVDSKDSKGNKFFIETLELDRRIVSRLKHRVTLSKKIADAGLAKEKKSSEDKWLKTAAEELGVDYESDEFAANAGHGKGRGQGRKKREKEARGLSKDQLGALRAELKQDLAQRVNIGVSERYLTAGGVNLDELLKSEQQSFLGRLEV